TAPTLKGSPALTSCTSCSWSAEVGNRAVATRPGNPGEPVLPIATICAGQSGYTPDGDQFTSGTPHELSHASAWALGGCVATHWMRTTHQFCPAAFAVASSIRPSSVSGLSSNEASLKTIAPALSASTTQ